MVPISTDKAPAAIGPYSQGIEHGEMVFLSGQIPVNPGTGEIPEGIEGQTQQVVQNIAAVLEAAKLDVTNVVKTTVFLTDMNDFTVMNGIYEAFFKREAKPFPARSCVQVAALPKGVKVEIECIAMR